MKALVRRLKQLETASRESFRRRIDDATDRELAALPLAELHRRYCEALRRGPRPTLPPFEELRQLPADVLFRMYTDALRKW